MNTKKGLFRNREWLDNEYTNRCRSSIDIAKELNVSDTLIRNWLRKHCIQIRSEKWTKLEIDYLINMAENYTIKEIFNFHFINKSYNAIRLKSSQLGLESIYNPAIQTEQTRRKISCSLRDIPVDSFDKFMYEDQCRIHRKEYIVWRKQVFKRDNYTCQNKNCKFCNNIKGVLLHAHHRKFWCCYPELRFVVSNGITYCQDYHLKTGLHKRK